MLYNQAITRSILLDRFYWLLDHGRDHFLLSYLDYILISKWFHARLLRKEPVASLALVSADAVSHGVTPWDLYLTNIFVGRSMTGKDILGWIIWVLLNLVLFPYSLDFLTIKSSIEGIRLAHFNDRPKLRHYNMFSLLNNEFFHQSSFYLTKNCFINPAST